MNWKDKLKLKYVVEEDVWHQFKTLTLLCYWHRYLLIRKCITVNTEHFRFNLYKQWLRQWFDEYVLNYEDLTTRQKRRIENFPFVGSDDVPTTKRYKRLYNYIDSEFLEYAKIKIILVRVGYIKGETNNYQVRPKSVICKLLEKK